MVVYIQPEDGRKKIKTENDCGNYPSHPNSTGQQKTIPTPIALQQIQLSMFCQKFGRK